MSEVRAELGELPERMRKLPVRNGYPVPFFVAWLRDGQEVRPPDIADAKPDFRIMSQQALVACHARKLCWVCGQIRGAYMSFVVGPMCAVNRVSSELPSHRECAEWSARNCPFLARPHMVRGGKAKPEGTTTPAGIGLDRNPGVALVWTTREYTPLRVPATEHSTAGVLFRFGDPTDVTWWAEGRPATREEVEESMRTGLPALEEACEYDADPADSRRALEAQVERARELLPA